MKTSAGIIPYTFLDNGKLAFFMGHAGGNDKDFWMFLKGELHDENILSAAVREFREESGVELTEDEVQSMHYLGSMLQRKDKIVHAYGWWTVLERLKPEECHSNIADGCNWPEIDQYRWIEYDEAVKKTHPKHVEFLKRIADHLIDPLFKAQVRIYQAMMSLNLQTKI